MNNKPTQLNLDIAAYYKLHSQLSYADVAKLFNVTRNVVAGAIRRHG